ncbi:hypothetical protein LUZ63_010533 [Rhynchospora breviuscula]|uniref:PPPDE domain-containing protein n=1 Tax=Rhynchospora breviuscula TaxID=2022672 RepID=A0A9Q0CH97_9POAL|nr:hypothetical protein LUZ63_010533 [Rhynchospora breviuscula]
MFLKLAKSFSTKELVEKKEKKQGESAGGGAEAAQKTPIYLNVYDISPINKYLYWFGLGIYHSGIQVHGMEYGYGAHEYPTSGVFEVEPQNCPGFIFRRSMWLGTTEMSRLEFRVFLEDLAESYHGDTYHLIFKNCNHFTDDLCKHLTGKRIPRWVNRLAKLGSFCSCILPDSIKVNAVGDLTTQPPLSDVDEMEILASIEAESCLEELDHQLLATPPNSEMTPPRVMSSEKDS